MCLLQFSAGSLTAGRTGPSADVSPASGELPEATAPSDIIPAAFNYASVFGQDDPPTTDYQQYQARKSQEALAFTGVSPGMTVVDLEAGGGVYTELFSRVVGDAGEVCMQNPAAFDAFPGDSVANRVDGRPSNVVKIQSPFDKIADVPGSSADRATWLLGPHELWYTPDGVSPAPSANPAPRSLKSPV